MASTWPLPGVTISAAVMPCHSAATMNSVVRAGPPSAQANPPRSSSTVCSTAPPSATRTHRLPGTSAYQTAFSASTADAVRDAVTEVGPDAPARQPAVRADVEAHQLVPVGVRDDQVELSAVTAIPLGNAMSPATWRTAPSAVTRETNPGANASPAIGLKPARFT